MMRIETSDDDEYEDDDGKLLCLFKLFISFATMFTDEMPHLDRGTNDSVPIKSKVKLEIDCWHHLRNVWIKSLGANIGSI